MAEDTRPSVDDYIKSEMKQDSSLFVDNIANCSNGDVEYIILVESPHKDEIDSTPKLPLMGKSGKAVSKFLFNNATDPMGKLVNDSNNDLSKTNNKKIAIVNVCNIPLQIIKKKNDNLVNPDKLKSFREKCISNKTLKTNLIDNLNKYTGAKIIIVCGQFARTYFDEIKSKITNINLRPLFVPHPSYNQWDFVYRHKDDISTIKWLFDGK